MKVFKIVKEGDEIEFVDRDNKTQSALVTHVDDKIFQIKVLRYTKYNKSYYERTLSFYLSGKKTHYRYNHGNATRIVNKCLDLN